MPGALRGNPFSVGCRRSHDSIRPRGGGGGGCRLYFVSAYIRPSQKCFRRGIRDQLSGSTSMPASLRCWAVIGAGASVSGSTPPPDFGNAITSRIESVPESRAQIRSQPKAMPPWGGGP